MTNYKERVADLVKQTRQETDRVQKGFQEFVPETRKQMRADALLKLKARFEKDADEIRHSIAIERERVQAELRQKKYPKLTSFKLYDPLQGELQYHSALLLAQGTKFPVRQAKIALEQKRFDFVSALVEIVADRTPAGNPKTGRADELEQREFIAWQSFVQDYQKQVGIAEADRQLADLTSADTALQRDVDAFVQRGLREQTSEEFFAKVVPLAGPA